MCFPIFFTFLPYILNTKNISLFYIIQKYTLMYKFKDVLKLYIELINTKI